MYNRIISVLKDHISITENFVATVNDAENEENVVNAISEYQEELKMLFEKDRDVEQRYRILIEQEEPPEINS